VIYSLNILKVNLQSLDLSDDEVPPPLAAAINLDDDESVEVPAAVVAAMIVGKYCFVKFNVNLLTYLPTFRSKRLRFRF
jgi:hypothetical protein